MANGAADDRPALFIVGDDEQTLRVMRQLAAKLRVACKTFNSAEAFLEAFHPSQAGCLIADLRLPGLSGTDLQSKLREQGFSMPVILVAGDADVATAVEALQGGAFHFVEKPLPAQVLLDCVQQALLRDAKLRQQAADGARVSVQLASLTPREKQVVDLLVEGLTNKEIAAQLKVSSQAIDANRKKAMAKLGVDRLARLIRLIDKVRSGTAESNHVG